VNTLRDQVGVYHWTDFAWEATGFTGTMVNLSGFNSEYYDGEATGIAIEGKTGEVLWFHVVAEQTSPEGEVLFWELAPTSSRGRELGLTGGRIYNDKNN